MKPRVLIALLSSLVAVLQAASQEKKMPPSVDPHQLHIISPDIVHKVLAARRHTRTSLEGPLALSSGLPLCTFENETIVGACPQTGMGADVSVVVIPVILNITQGGMAFTFDPLQNDDDCLGAGNTALDLTFNSPLFIATPFVINGQDEGTTQFLDAYTKAQFSGIELPGYTFILDPSLPTAGLTITLDAGAAGNPTVIINTLSGTQCGTNTDGTNPAGMQAVVDMNTIDGELQNYITATGLNATQFPFFVLYNSVMSVGDATNSANCCVLGFHNALGTPGQTYGIAEFEGRHQTAFPGVSDTSVAAHELGEWLDDPGVNNAVNAWGGIGQVSGCQSNLEIGDPLSGTLMPPISMPNGFTYNLQELAFFSWFTLDNPSLGAGGVYSSNSTFHGFAKPCPPGGTN